MEAALINPFLTAAIDIFAKMFGIVAQAGAPYLLGKESVHRWEMSGILGATGDYYGIICFRLHRMLADKMLQKSGIEVFTENERLETSNEMIGELTNIIAGNAATLLSTTSIEISPPAVIIGKNHIIAWPNGIPIIGIPFSTPNGPFEVDVCFRKKK
jgi:chemotaxis protein CheX